MFPSRFPFLCILQLLCITGLIAGAIVWTGNPLCLLAMQWAWPAPPIVAPMMDEPSEPEDGGNIGFLAGDRGD